MLLKKVVRLFACGSLGYGALEMLWRGYTHWSMALTGGVVFAEMAWLRHHLRNESLPQRCLSGAALITIAELLVGRVVNLSHRLCVWDYSHEPLNFKGQICAKYMLLWFALSAPAMELAYRVSAEISPRVK